MADHKKDAGKTPELPVSEGMKLPPQEEKKLVGHEEQKLLEAEPLAQKVKELEDRMLRLQAEFENYRKRAARENESVRESASAEVLARLLPVVDEFEIAVSHIDKSAHKDFRHGMEMIYSKLLETLKKEGVEPMKALGERFDPYKHDALRQGDGEEGKIVEVIQKGYAYKGKVLRHAKVVVGKGKQGG
jgi:molecular chaperone GrpE